MKAEIIAIGTEILLGQITNTNAQYLSQQLAGLGIDVYFQSVVGDNKERIEQAMLLAKQRADLVICTGGLGPTEDDMTKDVLASLAKRQLTVHEPTLAYIDAFFKARGTTMTDSNAKQADLIEESEAFPNDAGMAVGLVLQVDQTHFVLLPGPPREMKEMFETYTKPWLQSKLDTNRPLFSKMLKFIGIGESAVEGGLIDLIKAQQDPTIAPYVMDGEVVIRLSTKAANSVEADNTFAPTIDVITERLGPYLYAQEDIGIEEAILRKMATQGQTLSVAESCTGGLLSHLFTSIPGSSKVFKGGIVCYSNSLKSEMLHVPLDILEGDQAPGAISSETATMLADQILVTAGTDYAISVTGVSGPDPVEGKPVGLVYIGLAERTKHGSESVKTIVETAQYSGTRDMINLRIAKSAMYMLWRRINDL